MTGPPTSAAPVRGVPVTAGGVPVQVTGASLVGAEAFLGDRAAAHLRTLTARDLPVLHLHLADRSLGLATLLRAAGG